MDMRKSLRHVRLSPELLAEFHHPPDIKSIGKMILDPVWARKTHRAGDNELMHVIRGNVDLRLGRHRLEAGPGDTLLVPSGALHRDAFDLSAGLEVFYILFVWPPSRAYFHLVRPSSIPRLCASESIALEIGKLCDRMQIGLDIGTAADQLIISAYTHTILLLFLRETLRAGANPTSAARAQALMQRARQYIDTHYADEISLEQIANHLQISPFYLSHLFSRQSGFSLVEYITRVRMQKARDLLADGAKNVSEAAYAVGYRDSQYFSRVFHRYFGVIPKAARRPIPARRSAARA